MSKPRTRRVLAVEGMEAGKRYRVVLEGTARDLAVPRPGSYASLYEPTMRRLRTAPDLVLSLEDGSTLSLTPQQMRKAISIQEVLPSWQPGDVIVVRFNGPNSQPFTYVRGASGWLGERVAPPTDADVDRWIAAGTAQHVLREGKPVQ